MNLAAARILFFVFAVLAIVGEVARQRTGWEGGTILTVASAILCAAFARMIIWSHLTERKNIKLGSESLPPMNDVASVIVHGAPIPDERKRALLKALHKARRATNCGSVIKKIPFRIEDRWGGTWDLEAYEDDRGQRGFSINRVYYSGTSAAVVAECVSLPQTNHT
jgi:hypothetical protein